MNYEPSIQGKLGSKLSVVGGIDPLRYTGVCTSLNTCVSYSWMYPEDIRVLQSDQRITQSVAQISCIWVCWQTFTHYTPENWVSELFWTSNSARLVNFPIYSVCDLSSKLIAFWSNSVEGIFESFGKDKEHPIFKITYPDFWKFCGFKLT